MGNGPDSKFSFKNKGNKNLRILRVICQRPYFTGSGINLVNLVKKTKEAGIEQCTVFGYPIGEPNPISNLISSKYIFPVSFQNPKIPEAQADVPFYVAGMSDQMPYPSTKFSTFTEEMLESYLTGFAEKLQEVVRKFHPHLIHSHHLWLVSALCRTLFPDIPLLTTCHNTGLRQMALSPQLKQFVSKPIQNINAIAVIDEVQQKRVEDTYEFNHNRENTSHFFYIGQGINTEVFYPPLKPKQINSYSDIQIIYVGKLSNSKGLPQLIEAYNQISEQIENPPSLKIVGSGVGTQKENITALAKRYEDSICFLGQLKQEELAHIFRESDLFVLPSFYDGFPKVLLEALASGCRAIITDLPGIKSTLFQKCGQTEIIQFLPLPRMQTIDEPYPDDIPFFVANLKKQIKTQLRLILYNKPDYSYAQKVRKAFGSEGLFKTYLQKYLELTDN